MTQTLQINSRTFQGGTPFVFGPGNIPLDTNKAVLTIDVTNMVAGQELFVNVEIWDGVRWAEFSDTFTGPSRDKQGVLRNIADVNFDFGAEMINGVMVPTRSAAGWQFRATFSLNTGSFTTSGGQLVLT